MLEQSNKFKFSKRSYKAFQNNGSNGLENFIEENCNTKPSRKTNIQWSIKVNDLKKGKPVFWKNKMILPSKLNITQISTQKITNLIDRQREI